MQPAENKDYSRDVILRLSPTRNTIIVEEQKPGGIAAYREIDPLELYYVINQSYASNDYLDSGFLPEHCLHLSMSATEKYFVLWNPELRADVIYGDREYPNFPIPRMVFGVRVLENGKVAECSMGVVADEAPTMDTLMFFYPFSNVHSDDRVCTGNNVLPRYRKISALKNFPRYLLGLPDNDDMYDREHNRLKLSHGELLEHLKDKDPAYYYTDILVSNGKHWEILSAGGSIMAQLNPKEMQQALAKPFAPEDLEWRLQNTTEEKMRGLAVPYVTNRAIQNRLDEVCGPENWYNDFKPWHSNGKKEAQLCGIAIFFEGRGFITKWDGAEDSDIESVKGGLSDSMKRAAVQWGIGRVLYDLNTVWVEIEKRGRSFVIKDSERARLDNAYLSALKRLGLTPAAACGIQSLLTPKTLPGQTAPEENAPAASPQPKQGNSQPAPASALQRADQPATRSDSQQTQPVQQSRAAASRTVPFALPQSAARQRTDCYVVLSTKVQGGMSGSSTLVTLRAPDGKQIPAFARGARPELSTGTVLSNVKLTMRQQDTVAFYVLESYEIVPQEDRAA